MKHLIIFENFNTSNTIEVYHGGDIEGDIKSPFYVTDDPYSAQSYDDTVYSFTLDLNSNILNLTDIETFKKVKSKIYDNYSELYPKYLNQGWSTDRDHNRHIETNMEILKNFKNYDEIEKEYKFIKSSDIFDNIKGLDVHGFNGAYDDTGYVWEHLKKLDKNSDEYKKLNKFLLLHWVVRNMELLSDVTLNEFGYFFVDYCIENKYDAYKAISSDSSGRNRITEYCIINTSIIESNGFYSF